MPKQFTIQFGALAEEITEQLRQQSLRIDLPPTERQLLQRYANYVSGLFIGCILTEAQAQLANKRIMKKIKENIKPLENK